MKHPQLLALAFSLFLCSSSIEVLAQKKDANGINDTTVDTYKQTPVANADARYIRPVAGSSRKGQNPVLFLVGNSTMRTGTLGNGNNGQWGWGAFAYQWFDTTRITIENHALGGTSSRTFYNQFWGDVLKGVKQGDYVLIELGHNDNGPLDSFTARNSIEGIDPDTCAYVTLHDCRNPEWNGHKETVYSYGQYLRMFIRDIREKKAFPIIASLTPRNEWETDSTLLRSYNISAWSKAVADEQQVPWIDLEETCAKRYEKFGQWKTNYMFYYIDRIHTSRWGAEHNAYCAALAIQQTPNCKLKQYLKDLTPATAQTKRKPGKPVVWLCGDSTCKNLDQDTTSMWGWGSQAHRIFDDTQCTFANEAMAGRSARTYIREGRWDKVYNALQPGDVVLIQFGHNDTGNEIGRGKDRNEIATGLDSTRVFRHETTGEYLTVYSFGWYLKKMIQDAREKDAIPVLVSLTPRNEWQAGKIERRNDTYGAWYRQVTAETGVAYIDLHNITANYLDSIGQEATRAYYNRDHTHTSLLGAQLNAQGIGIGMKEIGLGNLILSTFNQNLGE